MTVKELYDSIGGNYTGALELFMNEKIVLKFALKFKNDKSFQMLEAALAKKDWHEAFVAAHTLKGICANLAFTRLLDSVSHLTDELRQEADSVSETAIKLFADVRSDYELTTDAIRRYLEKA